MIVLLTSPSVVAPNDKPDKAVVSALAAAAKAGIPVGVVSNKDEPDWFKIEFPDGVEFLQWRGRQDGEIVSKNVEHFKTMPHDFIVLGATLDDLQMTKNGGAVLVVAGWAADAKMKNYGLTVDSPGELSELLEIVSKWPGEWFFTGKGNLYSVYSLSNVSGKGVTAAQANFAGSLVATIKSGGPRLSALLVVVARSMLMSGIVADASNLMFGVYPSSSSNNDDAEILSDFTHHLRSVTSRVQMARRGEPLFVRHTGSAKRSAGAGGARTDPSEQIETLHLNPVYKGKIKGRTVVLLDDCTTYGVSFGVAAAFLRAAGAKDVIGIALGKFGGVINYYDISIDSDPFKPISKGKYSAKMGSFSGTTNHAAQTDLRSLLQK